METMRQHKISRLLQKDLGEIFQFEMKNVFGSAMITITKINVTKDLSIARVYLSVFGVEDKRTVLESVQQHSNDIRYKLGTRVRQQLRKVPLLEFFEDDSLDYIENLETLLDE